MSKCKLKGKCNQKMFTLNMITGSTNLYSELQQSGQSWEKSFLKREKIPMRLRVNFYFATMLLPQH